MRKEQKRNKRIKRRQGNMTAQKANNNITENLMESKDN
jgi:hypothetical protein